MNHIFIENIDIAIGTLEREYAVADTPVLLIDSEGDDLSRTGALTVLMIGKPSSETVHVFDVKVLTDHFFEDRGPMKQLLVSARVQKVFYDCRSDVDALLHQFQVRVQNCLDLQVFWQGVRKHRGSWLRGRYVISMTKCAEALLDRSVRRQLGCHLQPPHKTNMHVWAQRPLSQRSIEYAAADIHTIRLLLEKMENANLPASLYTRVLRGSERNLNAFRDHPTEIYWKQGDMAYNRRYILVEKEI